MVAAVDMWGTATQTYAANFPNAHTVTSRLEDLSMEGFRERVGPVDLLLASPECRNHTCAKGSAPRDEASRATAIQVVRFAELFRPRWLVLENVIYMRSWSRYEEVKSRLKKIGYHLAEHTLTASDFGVAQARRRLFLVGDLEQDPTGELHADPGQPKTVRSILDPAGTWKTSPLSRPRRARATLERAKRGFEALGKRSSFLLVYYGSDGSGGWQSLDRPLRTITTVDRFALVEPGRGGATMRMLQVPELKRAMGFEDDYVFPVGTRRDRIHLLGNGVCPPVMESVVRSLVAA